MSAEGIPPSVAKTVDYDGGELAVILDLWTQLHLPATTILLHGSGALPGLEMLWMSECLMIHTSFPSSH